MTQRTTRPHAFGGGDPDGGFAAHTLNSVANNHNLSRGRGSGIRKTFIYLGLCIFFEVLLWMMQSLLIHETLDNSGVEITKALGDTELFGTLFAFMPDFTALELFSLICGAFFVGLPVILAFNLLDPDGFFYGPPLQRLVSLALTAAYALVVISEFVMIIQRVALGQSVFVQKTGNEPGMAVLFGILFIVVNAACAYFTASLYLKAQQQKEG